MSFELQIHISAKFGGSTMAIVTVLRLNRPAILQSAGNRQSKSEANIQVLQTMPLQSL